MVSVTAYGTSETSLTAVISDLGKNANLYANFAIEVWRGSTLVSGRHNFTSSSTGRSVSYNVYGLTAGTQYEVKFWIRSTSSSSTDYYGSSYANTYAPQAPYVGGVGNVTTWDVSAGAIGVSWSYASGAVDYRVEVTDSWGNMARTGVTSSNSIYLYSLSQGTYYQVKVYARNGTTNGDPSYGSITTQRFQVGSVGTVYAEPSSSAPTVRLSWTYASNANYFSVRVYTNSGSLVVNTTTTNAYITVTLSENTGYYAVVYGVSNYDYSDGSSSYSSTFYTVSLAPAPITGLNVVASTGTKGKIDAVWSYANNATSYRWEIYNGSTATGTPVVTDGTTSTSFSYSGLSEYRQYTVKVYAQRSGYSNGQAQTFTLMTKDLTSPVVNSISGETVGKMQLNFSASDAHSGLRYSSTYYTEISNANGTSYGQGSYSTNSFRSFSVDGSGNNFVQDAWYYMRVTVYDNETPYPNTTVREVRIQYKTGRPSEWSWHTNKVRGNPISLTATEWNSFCVKINQFRVYKSLSNYSFSTAYSGSPITASIVNEARSAILAMSPPTSVPTSATAGVTEITASHFNTLSSSLNSIP